METQQTDYGIYIQGTKEALFQKQAEQLQALAGQPKPSVGLSGGSTPKEFYGWCVQNKALEGACKSIHWFTSDERPVPLVSEESNFGAADALLLQPLQVPIHNKHPWPTELPVEDAASVFNRYWQQRFTDKKCFDVCLLGVGEDCHIASIFPESPLLEEVNKTDGPFFSAVTVPHKGYRLTITPAGLNACEKIFVLVIGKNKAAVLHRIFEKPYDPYRIPAHLLRAFRERVTWLAAI